jgi:flavin-dependent dehydrogenase
MSSWDYEVAVIGGGPGGASAATVLARRGRSVLVLERDTFPRFHIGESQLPWSNEIFDVLGVKEKGAAAGFVKKWGASFLSADGGAEQYADFAQAVETPTPQTFQVPRARFDELLLDHAASCGAVVKQGCRVTGAEFAEDGVTLTTADSGGERRVRVGMIVDASGRSGFLARRIGRHAVDPRLRNIAVHAQFEGIPRPPGRRQGDIRMLTRPDMGWVWLIPISESVISVGAVVPQSVHAEFSKATAEESLEHYLSTTPGSKPLFQDARRVSGAQFDADYSYLGTRLRADRCVVVGDAAAFLDPIFSTGVLLALQSGIEAAEAIDKGLARGDLRSGRFAEYEKAVWKRYHHFRRFAVGFYDPAFRALWFAPSSRFGIYEAVLSILSGNWKPSLATRLRIAFFFVLVAIQRVVPVVARRPRPLTNQRAEV